MGGELRLERFDSPTETRTFEKGRLDVVEIGGMTVGATYEPGWKWSEHVGPTGSTETCQVEHVGLVVSGQAAVLMDDGTETVMKPGDLFHVPPGTTAGSSGTSPTSPSTSSARTSTPRAEGPERAG